MQVNEPKEEPKAKQDWRAMRWFLLVFLVILIGGFLGDSLRGDQAFLERVEDSGSWLELLFGR